MSEEDALLTQSLKKLKIETINIKGSSADSNSLDKISSDEKTPMFRQRSKSLSNLDQCNCSKKNYLQIKPLSFKKLPTRKKLLRDPVLNFIKYSTNFKPAANSDSSNSANVKVFGDFSSVNDKDFKSLVRACENISLCENYKQSYFSKSFRKFRQGKLKEDSADSPNLSNTCAHQARFNISPPCDVTIDELASYFETFVHIPKKMSVMAEMMYI